jgi:cobalamin biosynthesis protein CobT
MTSEINKRFADMRFDGKNVRANNIDPIAVENALRDLAQREEERKILIVLSDGQPAFHGDIAASYEHLREVVKQGERSGMEVIGIGIMTNAVEKYYEKNAVIKKVEELPSTLMSQLRQILLN